MKELWNKLQQLDGKGYKAYKSMQGSYRFSNYELWIDHVQGDPFATPSKIRIVISTIQRHIKEEWLQTKSRKIAVEDAIARSVGRAVTSMAYSGKGSGKSGAIFFDTPGQEVIERTSVQLMPAKTTICFSVSLPANGRRINGKEARKLFGDAIPEILQSSFFTITDQQLTEAMQLADQQEAIRNEMRQHNWVAFIANGSMLPRESGISSRPLKSGVPFQSPQESEVSFSIPHQEEKITGMAIPQGITLIVGGGYHGKSTILKAMERGVYNHVQGDGREFVLTDPNAVKIRAEDGRQISNVDISPFINNLPGKQDTEHFSTLNASGSTSQAASVIEALEAGATTLLFDEDTSATNFMIRDFRMQQLVAREKEPITPFIDKIKQLQELGVSTILVMGGSGDYFAVADHVVLMDEYIPYDATANVKEIINTYPLQREEQADEKFGRIASRHFSQSSLQTRKGKRSKIQAKGLHSILMGTGFIEFSGVEQIVDRSQTRMIAEIISYLDRTNELNQSLANLLDRIEKQLDENGLASFTVYGNKHPGDLARPRRHEIAAVFNRMRTALVI
ncbi:ABC-ATPase domain-containing protein [Virgibacillus sp. LDC-1]|uniref:ABC-ATPase domain-containing protein n=1 Tax=Virgibacillus sp. LDC-1 TaxID=3039856 RepID=UPI0024DE3174|nr:ABC-ATPase domain-containing protein [Virgibacillus sp. LDC-1]